MRTLSKIGLAALRVGFLIGSEEIINEVNKVRLPFNLNALSQTVAVNAFEKKGLMRRNVKSIISERKKLFKELTDIRGIVAYPSEANFILFKVQDADGVYQSLLKKGVLVRNMKGVVDGCLRVTIGTPEENMIFIWALKNTGIEG
jgi:histidinol-phosphate aminotransferase